MNFVVKTFVTNKRIRWYLHTSGALHYSITMRTYSVRCFDLYVLLYKFMHIHIHKLYIYIYISTLSMRVCLRGRLNGRIKHTSL